MSQDHDALHTRTLCELSQGLRNGEFSATELTEALLLRIAGAGDVLNAFITMTGEQALVSAAEADKAIAAGDMLPLTGLPLVHKDLFCTRDVLTTCGSHILDTFVSPYDAAVVERLGAAGAVMLGKTNMDEFAMGSSSETSYLGRSKTPGIMRSRRAAPREAQLRLWRQAWCRWLRVLIRVVRCASQQHFVA